VVIIIIITTLKRLDSMFIKQQLNNVSAHYPTPILLSENIFNYETTMANDKIYRLSGKLLAPMQTGHSQQNKEHTTRTQ